MKRLAVILALAGVILAGAGSWIHVKAWLSQVLLRAAWERTLNGATDARPWPWADTRPVARLVVGGEDSIVLEGSNGRALAFAPGHVEHTARPGEPGNCVITAHRDTHFAALRHVRAGDVISVQRPDGRWFRYRVDGRRVVDERETWVTRSTGEATLTLITCWPFEAIVAGGRERLVVTARTITAPDRPIRFADSSRSPTCYAE